MYLWDALLERCTFSAGISHALSLYLLFTLPTLNIEQKKFEKSNLREEKKE